MRKWTLILILSSCAFGPTKEESDKRFDETIKVAQEKYSQCAKANVNQFLSSNESPIEIAIAATSSCQSELEVYRTSFIDHMVYLTGEENRHRAHDLANKNSEKLKTRIQELAVEVIIKHRTAK